MKNKDILKKLIKEAIADRIKSINEVGDDLVIKTKIKKYEQEINEANSLKGAIEAMGSLKNYVSAEVISDMIDELNEAIEELTKEKEECEKNLKSSKKSEPKVDTKNNDTDEKDTLAENKKKVWKKLAKKK